MVLFMAMKDRGAVGATILIMWALFGAGCSDREAAQSATGQRVIAWAPSVAETVFALEREARLVGVSDYCHSYPPAATIPSCGGWADPNFETLVALRPDLILIQGRHEKVARFAQERDIAVLSVEMNTLATIRSGIRSIGGALDADEAADRLCATIQSQLDAVRVTVPESERLDVFITVSRRPGSLAHILSVGGDSFLSELVVLAGGRNILDDLRGYPQVSKEALVARAPDVILEFQPDAPASEEALEGSLDDWSALASLPAVQTQRIHLLRRDCALIPGPRLPLVARDIRQALWPDRAATPDL